MASGASLAEGGARLSTNVSNYFAFWLWAEAFALTSVAYEVATLKGRTCVHT